MIDDVKKQKPWVPIVPRHEGVSTMGAPSSNFEPGVDDPRKLLVQARRGDFAAEQKLEQYVTFEEHPDPVVWHEFRRLFALRQGTWGVGNYYGETQNNLSTAADRNLIEHAVRQMEKKALDGDWVYAVALYQFLGALNDTEKRLPWGENEELSAKWLQVIYKTTTAQEFKAIVAREAARNGESRDYARSKNFYPHTPDGWVPTK